MCAKGGEGGQGAVRGGVGVTWKRRGYTYNEVNRVLLTKKGRRIVVLVGCAAHEGNPSTVLRAYFIDLILALHTVLDLLYGNYQSRWFDPKKLRQSLQCIKK